MRVACAMLLAVAMASGARAAPVKQLGIFDSWSAHLIAEGKRRTCYIHAVPERSEGKYTRRGATYLQVTHRVPGGARDEVSLTAGYEYRKGAEVSADVDGRKFTLFTQGDGAWMRDAKQDAALVAAMRAGRAMVLRGVSARGTRTTDHYSLKGFTAAHNAIGKACGIG